MKRERAFPAYSSQERKKIAALLGDHARASDSIDFIERRISRSIADGREEEKYWVDVIKRKRFRRPRGRAAGERFKNVEVYVMALAYMHCTGREPVDKQFCDLIRACWRLDERTSVWRFVREVSSLLDTCIDTI